MTTFLVFIAFLLGCYWLLVLLRSERFWDWILGVDFLPETYNQPDRPELYTSLFRPYVPPAPAPPRVRRSFGQHHNPLALEAAECQEEFEQLDERTWQCLACKLVRFEKPGAVPTEN